jgi:hypothetical protein
MEKREILLPPRIEPRPSNPLPDALPTLSKPIVVTIEEFLPLKVTVVANTVLVLATTNTSKGENVLTDNRD